jgi:hypothetical protein
LIVPHRLLDLILLYNEWNRTYMEYKEVLRLKQQVDIDFETGFIKAEYDV